MRNTPSISRFFAAHLLAAFAICVGARAELPATSPTASAPPLPDYHWEPIGQGVFGNMFASAIHPRDPNIIIAGVNMGCAFRTRDGGKSWKFIGRIDVPNAQPAYRGHWCTAFDPGKPDNVWIGSSHGIFKSADCGETWSLSHGGKPDCSIGAIAVDPSDGNIVYAANGGTVDTSEFWVRGDIFKTVDGGATWRKIGRPGGKLEEDRIKARSWFRVVVDPSSRFVPGSGHQRLYVAGTGGFFVSEDAGESWRSLEEGIPGGSYDYAEPSPEGATVRKSPVSDVAVVRNGEETKILIGVRPRFMDKEKDSWVGGVYQSSDGGKTWQELNDGLMRNNEAFRQRLLKRPIQAENHFILGLSPKEPKTLYVCFSFAVFGSTDAGLHWRQLTNDSVKHVQVVDFDGKPASPYGMTLPCPGGNFKKHFGCGPYWACGLAVAPSDPRRVVFTDTATTYGSTDGGATWDDLIFDYGEKFRDPPLDAMKGRAPFRTTHLVRSRGPQVITPNDLAVDPFDPKTIAIVNNDVGLTISRDGGHWWEWAYSGIPISEMNCARTVTYDSRTKGRLFMGGTGWYRPGIRIFRSDDGGRNFQPIAIPQLEAASAKKPYAKYRGVMVNVLILDDTLPKDQVTLYAATTEGIFKTVDGGKTWLDISGPLASKHVCKLIWNRAKPRQFFAAVRTDSDKEAPGLYRSDDGAASWRKLAAEVIGPVQTLSQCQAQPDTIVVTAADPSAVGTPLYTLRYSPDAGEHWTKLDNRRAVFATLHPENPEKIYLGTFSLDLNRETSGLYFSSDLGQTWTNMGKGLCPSLGMHGDWHARILFDHNDPRRIFLLHDSGAYAGIEPPR